MRLPEHIRFFMPLHQQKTVSDSDEYKELIVRLEKELSEIPSRNEGNIVYAHFFYAGCDWFIKEWDKKEDLLFGYTILNGDVVMSEYGYIALQELIEDGRIELDFYWDKCTMEEALYSKYPDYFPKPKNSGQNLSEQEFDNWWKSTDFKQMERITGFRTYNFPQDEGCQVFVDACNDWWEKLSTEEKNSTKEEYE